MEFAVGEIAEDGGDKMRDGQGEGEPKEEDDAANSESGAFGASEEEEAGCRGEAVSIGGLGVWEGGGG